MILAPEKFFPLHFNFLSIIGQNPTQEVRRTSAKQQDTYECPNENRCNHCHPSLFLCRANDVPVNPNGSAGFCCSLGMSLPQPHRAALQKNQANPTGVLLITVMYPNHHCGDVPQCHGGHGYVYSMLKAP